MEFEGMQISSMQERQVWMKKLQDGWAFELERAKLKLFSVRFDFSSLPPRVFKAQV